VIDLFKWFIALWFNFGRSYAPRNVSISSRFSSLLECVFEVFPDDYLNFIGICCGIIFLIPNFVNLGLFPQSCLSFSKN
jgi:hypothetical protein